MTPAHPLRRMIRRLLAMVPWLAANDGQTVAVTSDRRYLGHCILSDIASSQLLHPDPIPYGTRSRIASIS